MITASHVHNGGQDPNHRATQDTNTQSFLCSNYTLLYTCYLFGNCPPGCVAVGLRFLSIFLDSEEEREREVQEKLGHCQITPSQ